MSKINVQGTEITIIPHNQQDYISLTDMLKSKDGEFFITDWMRNRNTLEFLGIWERLNNPDFNYGEFAIIKSQAGLNSFKISVKEWVEKTGATGIMAKAGRYGGTYAHKDIAFEFGTWISAEFKLYLIKEFQRLKDEEGRLRGSEWDYRRFLAKAHYRLQTDAIKDNIIPKYGKLTKEQEGYIYASEAEMVNMAVFGTTAKQWRMEHPKDALEGRNMRDLASLAQLNVLAHIESINSFLIEQGVEEEKRLEMLKTEAVKSLKALSGSAYSHLLPGQQPPFKTD